MPLDDNTALACGADDDTRASTVLQSGETESAGTDGNPESATSLSRSVILLFATASGLAVANVYFAHPLLDIIADDLGMSRTTTGTIIAVTQIGYGLGL